MIKIFMAITILTSMNAIASDFSGCGEYEFKGILRHDEHVTNKMIYVVNENTKSKMVFTLQEMDDVKKLAIMLDTPSKFKASITKAMDGTNGVLTFPYDIGRRLPDPLNSKDTGITKIKNFKCD